MARRRSGKRSLRGSKVIYEQAPIPAGSEPGKEDGERRSPERERLSRPPADCPVCGGPETRRACAMTARCGTCGTVFRDPPPARPKPLRRGEGPAVGKGREAVARAADAREALYESAFAVLYCEERREAKVLVDEAMRGFLKITRGKPAALNGLDKNVLEVDCGLGMRLLAFQGYGWRATGTEISATASEYARRQSLDVRLGSLAGMLAGGPPRPGGSFGGTRFDLVFFCGSLGRVVRPRRAAEKLRGVVMPGGLVCVLREPLACREAKLAADPSRLILYTADSLRRVFCEHKFSFMSQELAEGTGTFWFRSKARR